MVNWASKGEVGDGLSQFAQVVALQQTLLVLVWCYIRAPQHPLPSTTEVNG